MKEGNGAKPKTQSAPAAPVDKVDGIPDRSRSRPWWKYALLVLVFLAWAGFLIYCHLAGNL